MKIIFAIGHPSDVHFFKPVISGLKKQGHDITVIAREKEVTFYLLIKNHIEFINLSSHKKTILSKLINYGYRWWKTYKICRHIKPDVSIGVGDFILPQISRVLNFKSIVFTDIESVVHDAWLTFPFASVILTPGGFNKNLGKKHVRINSYKECAYINGNFVPDPSVLKNIGLSEDESLVVLRFVSHSAAHDFGYKGISDDLKIELVDALSSFSKILICSEDPLPEVLEKYRLDIEPEKIHSVLYYASLLYGESSTMAAEAALMGTPAIFVDKNGRGYTREIESRSGLLFNFTLAENGFENSIEKAINILQSPLPPKKQHQKRFFPDQKTVDISKLLIDILTK